MFYIFLYIMFDVNISMMNKISMKKIYNLKNYDICAKIVFWLQNISTNNTHLVADSRLIKIGDIFFAYVNKEHYILDAIKRGAIAIVYEKNNLNSYLEYKKKYIPFLKKYIPCLGVNNLHQLAGFIANIFYEKPDKSMLTIAITGTNGKTSCAYWLCVAFSYLKDNIASTAMIGTLGISLFKNGKPENFEITGYTTPDAIFLQRKLADLHMAGVSIVAIEASSIGLDQGRINGLHVNIALFTNFTRDHIDYHCDIAAYEAAKIKLFYMPELKHVVINLDDKFGQRLLYHVNSKNLSVIGYTLTNCNYYNIPTLRASVLEESIIGTNFYVNSPYGNGLIKTKLIGRFNISNILGVLGVFLAAGVAWNNAVIIIEKLTAVPGRMQQIYKKNMPLIIIDYAHTPDALEKTLITLRQIVTKQDSKLWCIFGCGGNRDIGKRVQMGAVSELADYVVLTSDNTRNEMPLSIISDIRNGMNKTIPYVIEDRSTAIFWTIQHAAKHDIVLLAGKGCEAYQEINGKKLPFLDADHVKIALTTINTLDIK